MTAESGGTWPGCHGIRLIPPGDYGLGRGQGTPILDVQLALTASEPRDGVELWTQDLGPRSGRQRLVRHGPGEFTLETGALRRLQISVPERSLIASPPFDGIQAQVCASFGMPIMLSEHPVLVVHAAAVTRGERALLIAGPGGAGKSRSLIGLIEAGWKPMSEDVCIIDLATAQPQLWPGPPWVRVGRAEPGPVGAKVAFETSEKTAFDLTPWMAVSPVPVTEIVLLLEPGGSRPSRSSMRPADAIAGLAPHAVWLGDPAERAQRLFQPVAQLVSRIDVSRLRLPRCLEWIDHLIGVLDQVDAIR